MTDIVVTLQALSELIGTTVAEAMNHALEPCGVRRGGKVAATVVAVAALLSACTASGSTPDPTPEVTPLPWTRLTAACPVLDGEAARQFGLRGEGRPAPTGRKRLHGESPVECLWGPTDGTAPAVFVLVEFWESTDHAQTAMALHGSYPVIDGVGDEARQWTTHLSEEPPVGLPGVEVIAKKDNTIVTLTFYPTIPIWHPTFREEIEEHNRLIPVVADLTNDVLSDLK